VEPVSDLLYAFGVASTLAAGAALLLLHYRGDCDIALEVARVRDVSLRVDGSSLVVACRLPLTNRGSRSGTVVEMECEVGGWPGPGRRAGRGRALRPTRRPGDGGGPGSGQGPGDGPGPGSAAGPPRPWRPTALRPGETVFLQASAVLTLPFEAPEKAVGPLLRELPGLSLSLRYKAIGRRAIVCRSAVLALPWEAVLGDAA
jgi:hypothetical protein